MQDKCENCNQVKSFIHKCETALFEKLSSLQTMIANQKQSLDFLQTNKQMSRPQSFPYVLEKVQNN